MGSSREYEDNLFWDDEQQPDEDCTLSQLLEQVDPIARCGTVYTKQDEQWNETFLAALSLTTKYWH